MGLSPARNSTVEVWPFSAARCMGVLNIRTSNVISYWAMRHLSSLSVTEGLALARYRVLMIFSSPLLQAMCKHVWPSSYMFSVVYIYIVCAIDIENIFNLHFECQPLFLLQ